jgi:hypothetical protein
LGGKDVVVMGKKKPTRESIIHALKELEAEGIQPGRKALEQKGINGYWITELIPEGLTELKLKHGIKLSPQEQHHSINELLHKIDEVVSHFKRVPTWPQLRRETRITNKVFLKQFGNRGKPEIFRYYRKWLEEHHPKSENIKFVDLYLYGQYKTKSPAGSDARRLDQPSTNKTIFVDLQRINELRSIKSEQFDFAKLVRLCEELNECYSNGYYFAVSALTRAVLDHIPPIFDFDEFRDLASQYGGKSFKHCMLHLENSSRQIANTHLHSKIRGKETLPNKTQVNFSNDLDVLLAEIVRLLK